MADEPQTHAVSCASLMPTASALGSKIKPKNRPVLRNHYHAKQCEEVLLVHVRVCLYIVCSTAVVLAPRFVPLSLVL